MARESVSAPTRQHVPRINNESVGVTLYNGNIRTDFYAGPNGELIAVETKLKPFSPKELILNEYVLTWFVSYHMWAIFAFFYFNPAHKVFDFTVYNYIVQYVGLFL